MKILKPTEVKNIEQFFQLTQEGLLKVMTTYLETKYDEVYATDDYIIAVGDVPIALVAHLDTVFYKPPENIFYDRIKNVMWSPEGLGADDRAGVYAIVQLIKRGFRPTIIFTTDEEKGALGASKVITDFSEPITDLKYIIQLDRRGSNDCVFYDCNNPFFEAYVETFGFVTAYGTFSDISYLCPFWGIAGVNLSIGYTNEHSYSETLYIGNMLSTIEKVATMLNDAHTIVEPFKYIPVIRKQITNTNSLSTCNWEKWTSPTDDEVLPCTHCGKAEYEYNLFPTKTPSGGIEFLCVDCVGNDNKVNWCINCGIPFIKTDEKDVLCCDCIIREEIYGSVEDTK